MGSAAGRLTWPLPPLPQPAALTGIGQLALFEAGRQQRVRQVPFRRTTLIRVLCGCKEVWFQQALQRFGPGQLLLVPAGATLDLGNSPDGSGSYRALILQLAPELLQRLAQAYPELMQSVVHAAPRLQIGGTASLQLDQALHSLLTPQGSAATRLHAALGVLLALVEDGFGQQLLGREGSIADRVHDLVELQPDHDWTAAELAQRLAISVATLHRQLRSAGQPFADIVQEVRLSHGLHLVLTTTRPIAEIAAACGYASASRFSIRFRHRFGSAPSELR